MIAFYLPGGMPVPAFALLLGCGAALGLVWVMRLSTQKHSAATLDGGLWVLLGCLVGARTGYVAVNWAYFWSQPQEIYQVQLGGLTWVGAAVGGLSTLFAVAGARKSSPGGLADALVPLGTALAVSAWLGCWLDGCAYGAQNNAWWALPALDEWGMFAQRLPLQLLGAGSILGLQAAIDWVRPRLKANGAAAAVWFAVFSFSMLVFSFLRADPAPTWQEIRLDTWAAGFYLVIASFFIGMYSLRPIHVKYQNPL